MGVNYETIKKINKLYLNSGYMDKYGSDVWASVIICLIFLLLTNYYIFANALEVVRSDWPNQKCNPLFLPFAGFINKPTNKTNIEYTAENFNGCIVSILKYTLEMAVQPLYFAVNILQEACNSLIDAFQKLRKLTSNLRNAFSDFIEQVYAGISNLLAAFMLYMIKLKDTLGKIQGILTSALFFIFGSYMALESLFLCIIGLIVIIIIGLSVAIMLNWGLAIGVFPIPFGIGVGLATPFGVIAISTTVAMVAILAVVIWFEVMMMRVLDLSTPPTPGVPGCFAEDTLIELFHTGVKHIKDITIGDILKNGSTVSAIIKCSAEEQNIYMLNNILVTGEHRVYDPVLKWVKVKDHPKSVYIPDFNQDYVYCLGTDKKEFTIGDTLFSDWDDIDDIVMEDLHNNCAAKGYLPENFTGKDIHTHLDSGFHASSFLFLENGSKVLLKDVKVNDKLLSGDKVVALVKIAAHDLEEYKYTFKNDYRTIVGTKNIHINDPDLGVVEGISYIKTNPLNCVLINNAQINNADKYKYHLLTDTKFFVVNDIRVNDYNSGIDAYLR